MKELKEERAINNWLNCTFGPPIFPKVAVMDP